MKTIIIDDQVDNALTLKRLLNEEKIDIEIVAVCKSAKEGMIAIHKYNPKLVFLDIVMEPITGFEMLDCLGQKNIFFNIIFTTHHSEYSIEALQYSDLPFLLKPILKDDLLNAIKLASEKRDALENRLNLLNDNLERPEWPKLSIPVEGNYKFIDSKNIIYLEASGGYSFLHLQEGKGFISCKKLGDYEKILIPINFQEGNFFRIQRSFIISRNFVEGYNKGNGEVILRNGKELSISRERKKDFELWLGKWFGF